MSSRQRLEARYQEPEQEEDFEMVQSLPQPCTRELLELLSTELPNMVRNAKLELNEERLPAIDTEEANQLKKELREAQRRIDELEIKLLEKDKGLKSYQNSAVINLENRLDHEKRSKNETEKKFQEASKLAEKLMKQVQTAESDIRWAKSELKRQEEELRSTKNELDDARRRLSKSMGDKLTDNNPNIADLSDKNRPTKLAERYQEIYDNEWTDAFETIQERTDGDEEQITSVLISILMETMKFCKQEADTQMDAIQKAVTKRSSSVSSGIPQNVKKLLKDCRKAAAEVSAKYFFQKYTKELQSSSSSKARKARMVPEFVEACFNICWLSMAQDPPIEFGPNVNRGDPFNTDVYKAYTRTGKRIEFVVWPALLLHRDGPVLCKGIAQGYDEASRRSKSAPPKDRKQDYSSERTPEYYSATVLPEKVRSADSYDTRNYQESAYETGTQKRETRGRRYNDKVSPVTSYRQPGSRQSRPTYKPKNLCQYDEYSTPDPVPTQYDIDQFFNWREKYGEAKAKQLMGERYDICLRYLIS